VLGLVLVRELVELLVDLASAFEWTVLELELWSSMMSWPISGASCRPGNSSFHCILKKPSEELHLQEVFLDSSPTK
jgi:hypothetical protein